MTAAQRRTVTVKVGGEGHRVEIQAEVSDPANLVNMAVLAYERTCPQPRAAAGFAGQHAERSYDRQPAGSPWQHNPTAVIPPV